MRIWPVKGWAAVRRWQRRGSGALPPRGPEFRPVLLLAWRGGGRRGGRRLHCTGRRVEGVEATDGPRWIWEGCACWSREAPAVVDAGCRARSGLCMLAVGRWTMPSRLQQQGAAAVAV